ncbi:MAG: superoxide dismutase [Candidatus Rokubacteria bacterium]|nr:superoxide dismutase [Candidatus Rokubacteria bacterium]
MTYLVQEQLKPHGLKGISGDQIEEHWGLYKGYVTNTNALLAELAQAGVGSRHWAELKRRAGFEWNGMVLHEYYFGGLASGMPMNRRSALGERLVQGWRSVDAWQEDFAKTGMIRGIGWVILYHDPLTDSLFNWWVSDHEVNHPAGLNPILVLDVFEHAYMVDHGTAGRSRYIDAFLENVNWGVVEQRFADSRARKAVSRFSAAA